VSTIADTPAALADALVKARAQRLLTQEEAARAIGISTRSLQTYEAGQGPLPRRSTLRRLYDWLAAEEAAA
jgi:transcriptional regulator with XRE-family HTH domain